MSELRESNPVWLPEYAIAESKPLHALSLIALLFALARHLSGETELERAQHAVCALQQRARREKPRADLRGNDRETVQRHQSLLLKKFASFRSSVFSKSVGSELKMRIGLFGGSFDPVHLGHLLVAQTAREELGLSRMFFIPAAQSPFKPTQKCAPPKERLRLLRLALAGETAFEIDEQEISRGGVSYTIDTVRSYLKQISRRQHCLPHRSGSRSQFAEMAGGR